MTRFKLTRRDFLKATGSFGIASMLASGGAPAQTAGRGKRKPNLLFIWTDEQRYNTMAAYGNEKIRTPNMNRLADKSVVFKKAYVTQPVCTPARSSVMTGMWPHQNGCLKNNIPLPKETKCLPELLNDPEYRSAYMGKWHLGDEIFLQHGFDEWVSIEDNYIAHYSEGRDRNLRSDYHHFLARKGYKPGKRGTFGRSFAASLPIEECKPKFLEMRACDFLRGNRGNPFVLYINFLEPHMPFTGPLDDMYDPDEIDLPENFKDPLEDNEPLRYRQKRESCRKKYGMDEKSMRKLIARYYGLVSQVDRSVGRILETLEELGLSDNTIVVYTSDHGDMMGAHGMVEKGVMYEESARVPWLMHIPQLGTEGHIVQQPVSHIDIVPTILDAMGKTQASAGLPGRSLIPLMKGGKPARDHVFIEWNTASPKQETIRTVVSPDGWKLCLADKDKSQLFNLNRDPFETTNLFYDGKHQDVIARLTERIRAWQMATEDTSARHLTN